MLVLWLEILYYDNAPAEPYSSICNHKTNNLPPQMTIFDTVIPILMHFLTFSLFKEFCYGPIASAFSNIKLNSSQSEAMFYNDIGYVTVYRRI